MTNIDIQIMLKTYKNLGKWAKHEHWSRTQLEAYQAEMLHHLREYVYKHSPFYQRFHRGLTDHPLQDLPVLTKAMMMENFDELVTDRDVRLEDVRAYMARGWTGKRFLNRYYVTTSSGKTDHPYIFLFNRDELAEVIFSLGRVREWAGWVTSMAHILHHMPIALLDSGNPWTMNAQTTEILNSMMGGWMPMRIFDVNLPLEEIVSQLNGWQPHMLTGYPSMIRKLTIEQSGGRLRIHPHIITTDSEVLTEDTRQCVEEAWGYKPFDTYWINAGGNLASERSDHKGLYLFEDSVIFEVVDEKYRPVPAGSYGDKLLITVLSSRTQPLIRYELNDRVRLASDTHGSDLPFAKIDGIQKRTEDILH